MQSLGNYTKMLQEYRAALDLIERRRRELEAELRAAPDMPYKDMLLLTRRIVALRDEMLDMRYVMHELEERAEEEANGWSQQACG